MVEHYSTILIYIFQFDESYFQTYIEPANISLHSHKI